MKTFQFPYKSRIMAKLGADAPIELFRSKEFYIQPGDWMWKFWTREFSPEWEVWIESHTPESKVEGGLRPVPTYSGPQPESYDEPVEEVAEVVA